MLREAAEKTLEAKQRIAEQRTDLLCNALLHNSSLNSSRAIAETGGTYAPERERTIKRD